MREVPLYSINVFATRVFAPQSSFFNNVPCVRELPTPEIPTAIWSWSSYVVIVVV
jgi:hypothetical protein